MQQLSMMLLFHPICHLDSVTGGKTGSLGSTRAGGLYLYIPRGLSNADTQCKSQLDRVCTPAALLHLDRIPSNSFRSQNAPENNGFPKGI